MNNIPNKSNYDLNINNNNYFTSPANHMSPIPIRDQLNMNNSISPNSLKDRINTRIDNNNENNKH